MTQIVLLGDIADVLNGAAFSSKDFITKDQAVSGDLPVFKMGNLSIGGGIRPGKDDYIPAHKLVKARNQVTRPYDILMCMTDMKSSMNLLGYSGQIKNEVFAVNQRVGIIRPKSDLVNPVFLYYYLNAPDFIRRIRATANSGVQVNISTFAIRNIEVALPSRKEQDNIAASMSDIDEKIELNRKMNETLEQMGQALFRYYFIDNPEAESWSEVPMGSKIKPRRGKSLQARNMKPGSVPVVSGGLQPAGLHDEANTVAPVITVSASGANAGYTALWGRDVWSADSSYIDITTTPYVYFHYLLLSRNQKRIYDMQTGAAQPHIYPSHLEMLDMPDAPDSVIAKFNNDVSVFFLKIEENKKEIQTLTTLRDTLLPRLIGRKIKL